MPTNKNQSRISGYYDIGSDFSYPDQDYERKRVLYNKRIGENGNYIYTPIDEVDIQDEINSYAASCNFENVLMRLCHAPVNQIVSAISTNDTFSADLSIVPKDLMEYCEQQKKIEKVLPNYRTLIKHKSFEEIIEMLNNKAKSENIEDSEVIENG